MSSHMNIFGAAQELNKGEQNNGIKKVKPGDRPADKKSKAAESSSSVKTDISNVGRELYQMKLEARGYVEEVKGAESKALKEIEAIREKLADNYYFDEEVINAVVKKILALPVFNDQ